MTKIISPDPAHHFVRLCHRYLLVQGISIHRQNLYLRPRTKLSSAQQNPDYLHFSIVEKHDHFGAEDYFHYFYGNVVQTLDSMFYQTTIQM